MKTDIYEDRQDAGARLASLGLDVEVLRDAVSAGQLAYDARTENDPHIYPALAAWAATQRRLREELLPLGWTRDEIRNQPLTISPDGGHAIVVFSGDEATGIASRVPQPRNPKGAATVSAVEANAQQLLIPFDPDPEPNVPAERRLTWVLLIHRDGERVRAELSLPGAIGANGDFISWAERVILPTVELGREDDLFAAEEEPPVDIDVIRKSE